MIFITIKLIKKAIKVLNSGNSPKQISAAFTLGSLIGLAPFNILYSLFIFTLLCLFNITISAGLLAIALFGIFSLVLTPIFHTIGYHILTDIPVLTPLFTFLYNLPLFPFTNFNNSITLGSWVFSWVLALPLYFLMKLFVEKYQKNIMEKIKSSKLFKAVKLSKPVQWISQIWGIAS